MPQVISTKLKKSVRRDISSSDFQKSDAHMRTIFDNTETAYLLFDNDLKIMSFNTKAEKLVMHEFGRHLGVGHNLFDYVEEKRRERVRNDYQKVLEGVHLNYESNFPAAFGKLTWYNFQVSPVFNEEKSLIGMVLAITDITKRKNAELEQEKLSEALKASHLGLKKLVAHVQTAKEEERLHIAREVHDELGQLLTTTKIELSIARKKLLLNKENAGLQEEFAHIMELIDRSIKSVKKIATDLRPEMLDELGLVESIRWQAEEFCKNKDIKCTLSISPDFEYLNHDINRATTLYRIVQESLTNIKRHAQATRVNIAIKTSIDNIFVVIQDNGVGITEDQKNKKNSFGLTGLRERVLLLNGIIDFTALPQGGTVVYVQIPYFI